MNNLIIIGNGFDLAHGMKASYNHFIEYLIDSHIKSNTFKDLFDFRTDFKDYAHYRELDSPTNSNYIMDFQYPSYFVNEFVENIIQKVSLNNWCDIEKLYFSHLNPSDGKTQVFKFANKLNEEFEVLKKYLAEYLKEQEKEVNAIGSYKKMFSLIDSR